MEINFLFNEENPKSYKKIHSIVGTRRGSRGCNSLFFFFKFSKLEITYNTKQNKKEKEER